MKSKYLNYFLIIVVTVLVNLSFNVLDVNSAGSGELKRSVYYDKETVELLSDIKGILMEIRDKDSK